MKATGSLTIRALSDAYFFASVFASSSVIPHELRTVVWVHGKRMLSKPLYCYTSALPGLTLSKVGRWHSVYRWMLRIATDGVMLGLVEASYISAGASERWA